MSSVMCSFVRSSVHSLVRPFRCNSTTIGRCARNMSQIPPGPCGLSRLGSLPSHPSEDKFNPLEISLHGIQAWRLWRLAKIGDRSSDYVSIRFQWISIRINLVFNGLQKLAIDLSKRFQLKFAIKSGMKIFNLL